MSKVLIYRSIGGQIQLGLLKNGRGTHRCTVSASLQTDGINLITSLFKDTISDVGEEESGYSEGHWKVSSWVCNNKIRNLKVELTPALFCPVKPNLVPLV